MGWHEFVRQNRLMGNLVKGNIVKSDDKLKFSAKHLDWMLQKLSEVKIGMVEIGIASEIWDKLTKAHKEIINEQRSIE